MEKTKLLNEYLIKHSEEMTSKWFETRKESNLIYGKNASPHIAEDIKEQNLKLIKIVADGLLWEKDYKEWAWETSTKRANNQASLAEVLRNFKTFRAIFWGYVVQYSSMNTVNVEELGKWGDRINFIFDDIIEMFSVHYQKVHDENSRAQREMMLEMSSPVIPVYGNIGILPLVGDVDTYRAKIIREKTLLQASTLKLEHLIVDLSGVPIIDTMVANELFQVIKALSMLGIHASITGISPAIALTSVNLGLDFSDVPTYANLQQALHDHIKA
ncbi:STAS domain-containing protein [Mesobacillus zeae]|uniref:STAS domain-containing protein n=1 Tax=Mesobacillus zeae TaxID=1917180 RepID=A0A398B0X0_9BACI|nr:STAS domain-containing protein [Mesobacillus zeae]RID81533.1 STAS domain-containing protein [Mesobacillus zeae]